METLLFRRREALELAMVTLPGETPQRGNGAPTMGRTCYAQHLDVAIAGRTGFPVPRLTGRW